MIKFKTASRDETLKLARQIALILPEQIIITFDGPLGSGKTTFIQGLVSAVSDTTVTSPTYVYHQRYHKKKNSTYDLPPTIYETIDHFDLYRVHQDSTLLQRTGIEEFLEDPPGWLIIEWPLKTLRYPNDISKIEIKTSSNFIFSISTTDKLLKKEIEKLI